jgi:hypothetical protein
MIREGKETYANKAAMQRHEKGESKAELKREGEMMKPCKECKSPAKCMKAGECMAEKPKSKLAKSML